MFLKKFFYIKEDETQEHRKDNGTYQHKWYGKLLFDTENNVFTKKVQLVFEMKTASEYRKRRIDIRPGRKTTPIN